MAQLSFDTAGRITLPENLCQMFALSDVVVVVGLGDRFQIWSQEAFQAQRASLRQTAREGLAAHRAAQRQAKLGIVG
jgi:MraZ protein